MRPLVQALVVTLTALPMAGYVALQLRPNTVEPERREPVLLQTTVQEGTVLVRKKPAQDRGSRPGDPGRDSDDDVPVVHPTPTPVDDDGDDFRDDVGGDDFGDDDGDDDGGSPSDPRKPRTPGDPDPGEVPADPGDDADDSYEGDDTDDYEPDDDTEEWDDDAEEPDGDDGDD